MSIRDIPKRAGLLLIALLAIVPMLGPSTAAAPISGAREARLAQVNVDWVSSEQAAALALDFPVLVPSWIPAPFAGAPSIQGGGGYYSLYWMVPGGDPTFLQVTGEVGGAMPVGSPADLNVRLEVNASVNGYDAIHDVTAIYDNVWWIQGGVLYHVSSRNMTGTDSLSLASSLVALQQAAPAEPTPTPNAVPAEEPAGAIYNAAEVPSANIATIEAWPSGVGTLRATSGTFSASGAAFLSVEGGSYSWQAPAVDSNITVEFTLVDDASGTVTAWSSIVVYPMSTAEPTPVPPTPTSAPQGFPTPGGDTTENAPAAPTVADPEPTAVGQADGASETSSAVQTSASGGFTSDGTAGPPMPRDGDGTAGPSLPSAGDGTGGIRQIAVP